MRASRPPRIPRRTRQVVDANASLSGGNIMGRWEKTLRGGNDIQVQAYYDRTNRYEPNLGERRDTFDVDFLQRLRLPARQQVSWGLGARFSHANDIEVVTGLTFVPSRRTDDLLSGFVQDEISLVEKRLSLVVGTKLLHTNFTYVEAEPSARLLWTPSESQTIWAAFTHAVRTPSDVEEDFFLAGYTGQTVDGLPLLARFNANPDFAPEQLNGYESGYRRLLGKKCRGQHSGFLQSLSRSAERRFQRVLFSLRTIPPRLITCFRRSSATGCWATRRVSKSLRNGGRRLSGACADLIRICI